jgi:hypothetical protein
VAAADTTGDGYPEVVHIGHTSQRLLPPPYDLPRRRADGFEGARRWPNGKNYYHAKYTPTIRAFENDGRGGLRFVYHETLIPVDYGIEPLSNRCGPEHGGGYYLSVSPSSISMEKGEGRGDFVVTLHAEDGSVKTVAPTRVVPCQPHLVTFADGKATAHDAGPATLGFVYRLEKGAGTDLTAVCYATVVNDRQHPLPQKDDNAINLSERFQQHLPCGGLNSLLRYRRRGCTARCQHYSDQFCLRRDILNGPISRQLPPRVGSTSRSWAIVVARLGPTPLKLLIAPNLASV